MQQAIAGVAPLDEGEVSSMVVWPSIAATPLGRLVGRLAGVRLGVGRFFTLGRLLALATIPIALVAFVWKLMPFFCRRYRLTSRRIIIQKGLSAVEQRSVGLDEFDSIDVEHLPGQKWLRAGEIILRSDGKEVLRLSGVGHPESFRQACLKVRTALISIRQTLQQQAARADEQAVASRE